METRFFNNTTKKYFLLFPLSILIGAVGINMLGLDKIVQWNLFDAGYISSVISADLEFIEIFYYLLKKRSLHIVLIVLVCFSTIKDKLLYGIVSWLGVTFGAILGAVFLQYGFNGIWMFVVGILVHMLIYIVGTVLLLHLSIRTDKNILSGGYVLCFALFCVGVLVETVLNWGIFPKIIGLYH